MPSFPGSTPLPARLPRASTWILALALLLLSGCVVGRFSEGGELSVEQIAQIEPGVTTKQQILAWFGPPQNYTEGSLLEQLIVSDEVPEGSLAPYRFSDVLAYQFHEGRLSGVILILFNYIRLDMDSDHLVIFFDEDDVVRYFGMRRRAED